MISLLPKYTAAIYVLELLVFTWANATPSRAAIGVYNAPSSTEFPRSKDFTKVEVRSGIASGWQEVVVYDHESTFSGHAGIAAFSLSSSAEVRVTYKAPVTAAAVLPSRRNISTLVAGNSVTFKVTGPQNLVLNLNGERDHPLCLFINPVETYAPKADDPDVDYYPAGQVTRFRKTNKHHIYIPGGAVVKGGIALSSNTTVSGFGMLYQDENKNPLISWQAQNISLIGITVYNFGPGLWKQGNWSYLAYATSHLTVDNVKFFDVYYGEDGIDLDGDCQDITIRNCFFHVADDGISPKATSWQSAGHAPKDIMITHNIFWQDMYGNPFHIGGETWSNEITSGIKLIDNDIVHAMDDSKTWPTDCLVKIDDTQGLVVDGLVIDGLYVENSDRPRLFSFTVGSNADNRGIGTLRNFTIKNVVVKGDWKGSEFSGNDPDHQVRDITFTNLSHNGQSVTSPEAAQFHLKPFTSHIAVISGAAGAKQTRTADGPAPDRLHSFALKPLPTEAAAFKAENAVLTKSGEGLDLLADTNPAGAGRAIMSVIDSRGVVSFSSTVAPDGQKFVYPNCSVFMGNSTENAYVAGFVDPNTGHASITQRTTQGQIQHDEKAGALFFAKDKRNFTLTIDFPAKAIHFSVGDFEMIAPLADNLMLDSINVVGLESYRTGATYSNLRFGASNYLKPPSATIVTSSPIPPLSRSPAPRQP